MSNNHQQSSLSGSRFYLLIASMPLLSAFVSDFWLPALPKISQELHVSVHCLTQCISCYLLLLSTGQIFWGWLQSKIGGHACLYLGAVLIVIGTIGLLLADSFAHLFFWRMIQAIGVAAPYALYRCYLTSAVNEITKGMLGVCSWLLLIAPTAPLIGGWLLERQQSWRQPQWLVVFLVVMLTLMYKKKLLRIPRLLEQPHQLSQFQSSCSSNLLWHLSNRKFMLAIFYDGMALSVLALYLITSPWIYQQNFHFSALQHGAAVMLDGLSALIANSAYQKWMRSWRSKQIVQLSAKIMLIATFILASIVYYASMSWWQYLIIMNIFVFAAALIFASSLSQAYNAIKHATQASIVWFSSGQVFIAMLYTFIMNCFHLEHLITLVIGMGLAGGLIFFVSLYG